MEKFEADIKQIKNLLENKTFGVEIRCDDYLREQQHFTR
jgi:hypothetical protein